MRQEPFSVQDGLVLCSRDEVIPEARQVPGTGLVNLICWKCHRKAAVPEGGYTARVLLEHPEIYHLNTNGAGL